MSLFERIITEGRGVEGLAVPHVFQSTSYSCGSAALLAALRYWRMPAESERELMKALGTNWKRGTEADAMSKLAKKVGLHADLLSHMSLEALKRRVNNGETVIAEIQARPSPGARLDKHAYGHYVVVVGVDDGNVYFMDPRVRAPKYGSVRTDVFKKAWIDSDGIRGLAVAIRGAKGLGKKTIVSTSAVRTGRESKVESLYDRVAEGAFDGVPQAMNVGGATGWALGQDGAGYALPMKNDLPGNMNPRTSLAAAGTRWQNKRAARGRGDAIKPLTPPPSMVRRVGEPEQGSPPGARRPS